MQLDRLDLSSIGKAITGDIIHEAKHKLNDLKEKAMEQSEVLLVLILKKRCFSYLKMRNWKEILQKAKSLVG